METLKSFEWKLSTNICLYTFRSQKVAGTMQSLMGGDEIYHYGSKVGAAVASYGTVGGT